jgi:AraC-like DNA-binding protein
LSDLLRRETGLSAQGHIHQQLVDNAKRALASSEESIAEIAFGLGFEQPQSLTRLFKKHTGVTPKDYRSNLH